MTQPPVPTANLHRENTKQQKRAKNKGLTVYEQLAEGSHKQGYGSPWTWMQQKGLNVAASLKENGTQN